MNLAIFITTLRIVVSPLFFIICTTYVVSGTAPTWTIWVLWGLGLSMEASDWFDGVVARATNSVTEIGKLLDPFADSVSRLTYFLAFVLVGLMPAWVFLLILYRDLGVSFVRILQMRRGIVFGAQTSGKIKAWVYGTTGGICIGLITTRSVPSLRSGLHYMNLIASFFYSACAIIAVWTMIDYARSLNKPT